MNRSDCSDVERGPGRISGSFVVKGTRILGDGIIDIAANDYSAEEIMSHIYVA